MATAIQETIHRIPFDKIDPSPTNPRKTFPEKGLKELAANFEQHGITAPLVGRTKGKRVMLVFGERRWKAAQLAKASPIFDGKTVPVILRDNLSDEVVREMQLSENIQREDLHPMEEAETYEEILKHPDYTIEKLAARLGKPVLDTKKRLYLLRLITPFRKQFLNGEIGVEQAEQLCRLTTQTQTKMLETWKDEGIPAAKQLKEVITTKVFLDLASAPFSITDANLVPAAGACTTCQKRTGADPGLFADILPGKKKEDFCLDRPCFRTKTDALITIKLQPKDKESKPLVPVSTARHYLTQDDKRKLPEGIISAENRFHTLKSKDDCKHAVQALVVHGDGIGQETTICYAPECKEHGDHHRGGYQGTGESETERANRLKKDRAEKAQKETRRNILIHVGKKAPDKLGRIELETLACSTFYRLYNELQRKFLGMAGWLRDRKSGESWEDLFSEQAKKLNDKELNQVLVMLSLATHMDGSPYGDKTDLLMEFAVRYKVNVKEIEAQVAEKYEPKSKAADKADAPKEKEKPEKKAKAKKAGK
jgi:ParB/RepB/Spo0J family partition protein